MTLDNDKDNEITDQAIAEVLTGMANTFRQSDDERFGDKFTETFNGETLTPAEFWSKYAFPNSMEVSTFSRNMAVQAWPNVGSDKIWLLDYLYENYGFVKRFLSQQLTQREGHAVSVDKARAIMSLFIKHVTDPNFVYPNVQNWHYPQVDTIPLWVDMVYALPYLTSGQLEKIMNVTTNLDALYSVDPTILADNTSNESEGGE